MDTDCVLDDLQIHTMATLSDGAPLLALDMAGEAFRNPPAAPRHVPDAAEVHLSFGASTIPRVRQHLSRIMDTPDSGTLQQAALNLSGLGIIPNRAASLLVGSDVVSTLLTMGVAQDVSGLSEPHAVISCVNAMALGVLDRTPDAKFTRLVDGLQDTGFDLGEKVLLRRAEDEYTRGHQDPGRALQAAAILNRIGRAAAAMKLVKGLDADLTQDQRHYRSRILLRSHLLVHDHVGAAELARELVSTQPDATSDSEVIYDVSLTVSWLPKIPTWYIDWVRGPLRRSHPAAAMVIDAWSDHPSPASGTQNLRRIVDTPDVDPMVRLMAAVSLLSEQIKHDPLHMPPAELAVLNNDLDLVWRLLDGFENAHLDPQSHGLPDAYWVATGVAVWAMLMSGAEPESVDRRVEDILDLTVIGTFGSGWLPDFIAARIGALVAAARGDTARSARNEETSIELTTHGLLPALTDEAVLHSNLVGLAALREQSISKPTTPRLTVREDQVTHLLSTGLNNHQIARKLFISVRSVEAHVLNARRKLGAKDRAQLAQMLRRGR